jgi:endonuclease YncB( thermonuclease family)
VLLMSLASRVALAGPGALQSSWPNGVPESAEAATIADFNDGDKIFVEVDGRKRNLLFAGIDAPEPDECFRAESINNMKALLPIGTVVYLEVSGDEHDGKDRLIRYVWLPGEGDAKATLINTKLVRDGYAGFDGRKNNPKYFDRLQELEAQAKKKKAGLWGVCGSVHAAVPLPNATNTPLATVAPPSPTPTTAPAEAALITDCSPFASYDEANAYYGAHPEAAPYLDPNYDGRACEVYFGVDQQVGLSFGSSGGSTDDGGSSGGGSTGGGYTAGDYDCGDFSSHAEAQSAWEANGGSASYNLWGLDSDGDGIACESLP